MTNNGTIHYILKLNILKHLPVLIEMYLFINTLSMEIILILSYMHMNLKPREVLIQVYALHNRWPIGKKGSRRMNDLSILSLVQKVGNIKMNMYPKNQRKYPLTPKLQ